MPQCTLCESEVPKLVESHIIPKSLYGTALKSTSRPAKIISSKADFRPVRSRVGEYDDNLLCSTCEESLSQYDDYANQVLLQSVPSLTQNFQGEPQYSVLEEVDVAKLRMFFVSLERDDA